MMYEPGFMAANRCAGRYLVATAQGEASYGAANVIAQFELFLIAGFTFGWWLQFNNIVWLFILLSGFIIYRYRESRVMTLAQFFEVFAQLKISVDLIATSEVSVTVTVDVGWEVSSTSTWSKPASSTLSIRRKVLTATAIRPSPIPAAQ